MAGIMFANNDRGCIFDFLDGVRRSVEAALDAGLPVHLVVQPKTVPKRGPEPGDPPEDWLYVGEAFCVGINCKPTVTVE